MNPMLEKVRLRALEMHCTLFACEVLGMEIGPHSIEWAELIRDHKRIAIQAARDHGKSAFWSFAYPLWRSWRQPGTMGVLVSDTEGQVKEFFEILKSGRKYTDERGVVWTLPCPAEVPELASIVPSSYERTWAKLSIKLLNGSRFQGYTFGKRFRGKHPDWIVVDDPLGADNAYSPTIRERDKDFFFRDISPMPVSGGQLVVVGTPLHGDDLQAELQKNSEYVGKKYPAIVRDERGREAPLWPERFTMAELEGKRREVGSLAFAQEYMLRPATSEASIFPRALFELRSETLDHAFCIRPPLEQCQAAGWSLYTGTDFAISVNVGADYTVIIVLAVDDAGNRWIVDIQRWKGVPFHAQLTRLKEAFRRWQPELMVLEANQMQRIFGDELRRTTDLPVKAYNTGVEKNDLARGVPSLRTLIENGKLRFPRGDAQSIELTDLLIEELTHFSWVNDKLQGVGSHDDLVMALWLAEQAVRMASSFTYWSAGAGDDIDEAELLPPQPRRSTGGSTEMFDDEDRRHEAEERASKDIFCDGLRNAGAPYELWEPYLDDDDWFPVDGEEPAKPKRRKPAYVFAEYDWGPVSRKTGLGLDAIRGFFDTLTAGRAKRDARDVLVATWNALASVDRSRRDTLPAQHRGATAMIGDEASRAIMAVLLGIQLPA